MLHGVLKARLQPVVLWLGAATAAVLAGALQPVTKVWCF
jgi:hypothetical protein